jgi:hypothetical protein
VLAIVFIGGWLLIRNQRDRDREAAQRIASENQNRAAEVFPPPVASPAQSNQSEIAERPLATPQAPSPKPEPKIATFALTTGLVRDSSETKILAISKSVESVQLGLEVERNDYPRYRAVLRTPDGQELWSGEIKNKLPKPNHTVVVRLPASIFSNADYILTLNGLTSENTSVDEGKYYFRVQLK